MVEEGERPDPHAILDRLSLINARRHVAMIAADPTLISKAQTWSRNDARRMVVYRCWRFLLERHPLELVLRLLVEDSARGRWIRSGNPFSLVTPPETEAERGAKYRQAKRDVEMASGSLSGEFAADERNVEALVNAAIQKTASTTQCASPDDRASRN